MKRPFFPVFVLTLTILFIIRSFPLIFPVLFPLVVLCFLLSILFYTLKSFRSGYLFIAIAIALMFGIRFSGYRDIYTNKISGNDFPVKKYITVNGKVLSFPDVRKENSFITVRAGNIVLPGGSVEKRDFSIRISVKGDAGFLIPGEWVSVDCVVDRREFRENFFPNPMKDYLLSQNLHFSGHTKSALLIRKKSDANLFFKVVSLVRKRVRGSVESMYLLENGSLRPPGQLLEALLLGERGRLGKEIKETLLNAGVFHLFAISGAHIGIITLFSLFILAKFRIKKRTMYIIVITILLIFLSLTGFKISAQRAVIMAVFILVGKMLYLKSDIINIISVSGLFILSMNPAQFLDPGFILTFAVTFGIIAGRYFFIKNKGNINNYFKELLVTNLSASIVSLPFSLFYFKRYSFAGIFSGLLLLPLTGVIMSISIPLIPISMISIPLAKLLMLFIQPFVKLFFLTAGIFARFVQLVIYRPSPSLLFITLFMILFSFPNIFRLKGFLKFLLLFSSLVMIVFFSIKPARYAPSSLEVFFLDVGQGDSEVVVFPGGDSLLIDGGGSYFSEFEVGRQVVLPFLVQKRIDIKWIAISHFHPDHCRGIIEIVNILNPEELWISSFPKENEFLKKLLETIKKSIRIKKTDSSYFKQTGGCEIKFLFPEKILHTFYEKNDNSQVIKIFDPAISFLFSGDIEKATESYLSKKKSVALRSRVLKVPHHGSDTSSTLSFLKKVSPEIAVISLSKTNRFGFPHEKVLRRYKDLGIKILRTSEKGGIKVSSKGGEMVIVSSKYNSYFPKEKNN